jgi:hypothetical protein
VQQLAPKTCSPHGWPNAAQQLPLTQEKDSWPMGGQSESWLHAPPTLEDPHEPFGQPPPQQSESEMQALPCGRQQVPPLLKPPN